MAKRITAAQKEAVNSKLNISKVLRNVKRVKAFGQVVYLVRDGKKIHTLHSLRQVIFKVAACEVNYELLETAHTASGGYFVEDYRVPKEAWEVLVDAKSLMIERSLVLAGFII